MWDADSPEPEMAADEEVVVRMNSAAIWLEAPWLGGRPRYVVAIMLESSSTWPRSRAVQNEVGTIHRQCDRRPSPRDIRTADRSLPQARAVLAQLRKMADEIGADAGPAATMQVRAPSTGVVESPRNWRTASTARLNPCV